MFERLLVPTDGSDVSHRSIVRAGALAEAYDAEVCLLHVVDSMTLQLAGADEGQLGRQGEAVGAADVLSDRADAILEDAAELLEDVDVPVRTARRAGPPAETIETFAEETDTDLTVVSDRGRNRVEQFFLGSIPLRLFRRTSLPLWVSKPKKEDPSTDVEDVVFPVDDSPIAERTARYVGAIAGQYDATLHLVSVVDKRQPDLDSVQSELEADCRAALASVSDTVADSVEVTTTLRQGKPSKEILAHAREQGTDLISIGAAPRGRFLSYLTIPVAERVLRRADQPVMTIRTGLSG